MGTVQYEIEMLNLGNADCFIINYRKDDEDYLIVIDSGNTDTHGEKIVTHINRYYGKEREIDLAINTHLHDDHISGFEIIVERKKIKEFWIHDPFALMSNINESVRKAKRLIDLLKSKDTITVRSPYAGLKFKDGLIEVLGPSEDYYKELYPKFKGIKDIIVEGKVIDQSSENNSSVIALFKPKENLNYLFTGDAGPSAFKNINFKDSLYWLAVPHHGSKYNFYDIFLTLNPKIAYISACGKGDHPSAEVIEKLRKNKCKVYCSNNGNILYRYNIPRRKNYSSAKEFYY